MPKIPVYSDSKDRIETLINNLKSKYPVRVNIDTNAGVNGSGDPYIEIVDTEVPTCITFMSFGIDVSNLDIILTPNSLLPPIRVSNLSTLLASVIGKGLDSELVLRSLEIYKMNGKLDEFASNLNSSSTVLGSVTGVFVSDLNTKLDREVRGSIVDALYNINRFCQDLRKEFYSSGSAVRSAYRKALEGVPSLILGQSDAKYYELSVANVFSFNGVTDIKAYNMVEMADLVMDGDDIVFSSDIKKSLTKLGFDKLITARELTSVSNAVQKHAIEAYTSKYGKVSPRTYSAAEFHLHSFRGVSSDVLSAGDMDKMFSLLKKIAKVYGKVE